MRKVVEIYFEDESNELVSKFPHYKLKNGLILHPKVSHGAYGDILVCWPEPVWPEPL